MWTADVRTKDVLKEKERSCGRAPVRGAGGLRRACRGAEPTAGPTAGIEMWIRQAPSSPAADTARPLAKTYTVRTGVPVTVVAISNDFETKLWQRADDPRAAAGHRTGVHPRRSRR